MRRRRVLQGLGSLGLVGNSSLAAGKPLRDIEERIRARDFASLRKQDLATPALLIDQELLEANLARMATRMRQDGMQLRPHFKVHKSLAIARRQMQLGAVGIGAATIAEAELLANAGMRNLLLTGQVAGAAKLARVVRLARQDPQLTIVAGDPRIVDQLDEAAKAARLRFNVLTDLYAGMSRAGAPPGEPGLNLARDIASRKHLRLAGIMGYSGDAAHTHGFAARAARSKADLDPVMRTVELCRAAGLQIPLITGGSTGTYNIDRALGVTELQAGSYVLMDTRYLVIGGQGDDSAYRDFDLALTMLVTVIHSLTPGEATFDAGSKASVRPTDQVKGRPDIKVDNQGAEYGVLKFFEGAPFEPGQTVEIIPSGLDMTTNYFDRFYVCAGDRIVDVWPIMERRGPPQR